MSRFVLATAERRLGRCEAAVAEYRRAIDAASRRVGLGLLLRSQGRDAESREVLAGIVTAHPRPAAEEYALVVHAFRTVGDAVAAREWTGRARARYPADPRFR